MLKISEDERVSFDPNSLLLLNLKNNQADIKTLVTSLTRIDAQNSQFIPELSQINDILSKWEDLVKI